MDDQYNILIETPQANLSRAMRQLNGVYGHDFSRRHRRPGQVLGGRYKAQLVEKDSYLLEFARYVVLAPVRAGLVTDPARWRWSSYSATAGEAPVPPFLVAGWLLALLRGKRSRRLVQLQVVRREGPQGRRTRSPPRRASDRGPGCLRESSTRAARRRAVEKGLMKKRRAPPRLADLVDVPRGGCNAGIPRSPASRIHHEGDRRPSVAAYSTAGSSRRWRKCRGSAAQPAVRRLPSTKSRISLACSAGLTFAMAAIFPSRRSGT